MYLTKLSSRSATLYANFIIRRLLSDQRRIPAGGGELPYKVAERRTVEWNGKLYSYPYRGAWEEEFSPELWEKLHKDNVLTANGEFKPWKIKDAKLRRKVNQLWYQMDDGKPIYSKGYFDYYVKTVAAFFLFLGFVGLMYASYNFAVPKNENIFESENWVRWRKESHHD